MHIPGALKMASKKTKGFPSTSRVMSGMVLILLCMTSSVLPATTEFSVGQSCSDNPASCVTGSQCDSGTCKFSMGQSCSANSASCVTGSQCDSRTCKISVGQSCSVKPTFCVTGSQCDSGTCKISVGQSCSANSASCVTGSQCDSGTCRKIYGSNCNAGDECQNTKNENCPSDGSSPQKCLCSSGFFRSNKNVCTSVTSLKVGGLTQTGDKEETSIMVHWTKPTMVDTAEYRASLDHVQSWSAWSTSLAASFSSGVTPGEEYTVTVSTRTKKDPGFGNNMVQNDNSGSVKVYTSSDIGPIIGAVVAVVVVIIIAVVVVVLLLRRRKRDGSGNPRPEPAHPLTSVCVSPDRKPVKLQDFAAHLERFHRDSNLMFQKEYKDIEDMSPKHYSQEAAFLESNRMKTRFVNILPYDHTRVKLDTDVGDTTSDFINANYITGYRSPREYIATQDPMVSTVCDFWRMVWEQKSSLIVMLSDLEENGRPRVDKYWPKNCHTPVHYEEIVVEMTPSTVNPFPVRTFKVCKEDQKGDVRRVVQYFLPGLGEHSSNLNPNDMLDSITATRQEARSSQGPIIVHCSSGVGRTAVFIALDFLMQFVEEHGAEDKVDIFNLVLTMRHSRPLMVQTEKQYIFIHDTLKKMIDRKLQAMQEEHPYTSLDHVYVNKDFNPYDSMHEDY